MKFWHAAILSLAVALVGCRGGGDVQALQDENFLLREQILELQVQKDQICGRLRSCQGKLQACEQSMLKADGGGDSGGGGGSSPSDLPKPPKVEGVGPTNGDDGGSAPPFKGGTSAPEAPDGYGPPANFTSGHSLGSGSGEMPRITHVTFDPRQTDGMDSDPDQPGDEGVVVVLEPRDEEERLVRASGEVVIEAWDARLLDEVEGSQNERQAHVATWMFTPEDAATWFHPREDKLHFELTWPEAGPPQGQDLILYVQYIVDGHTLEAETQVQIRHTGRRQQVKGPAPQPREPHTTDARGERSLLQPKGDEDRRTTPSRKRPTWRPYR